MITESGILGGKRKVLKGFGDIAPKATHFKNQRKIILNMKKKATLMGSSAKALLKHNLSRRSVLLESAAGAMQGAGKEEKTPIMGAVKGGLKGLARTSHVIPLGRGKGLTGGQLAYIKNQDKLTTQYVDSKHLADKLKKKRRTLIQ